jgi:hypothetical protein
MTNSIKTAGLAGMLGVFLAAASPAQPPAQLDQAVHEDQAVTTQLDANTSAITYWASSPDGWHVVTTIDTVIGQDGKAEKHAVVRFSSLLQPGQSQLISVPVAVGEGQQVLRILRLGDQIKVAQIAGSSV